MAGKTAGGSDGRGGYRDRRIRKVTAYVCTTCYEAFPDTELAKEHWAAAHGGGTY